MSEASDVEEMADAAVLDRLLAGVTLLSVAVLAKPGRTVASVIVKGATEKTELALSADDETLGQCLLRCLAVARGER